MTEAQKCLYHIAENMRMDKSISKEGYEYFQQAIKALDGELILDKIKVIVKEWQNDSWTDGLSYECMSKIAELIDSEVEE